ncbi:hypothetical protein M569_16751, partial [Genlisea aurea]
HVDPKRALFFTEKDIPTWKTLTLTFHNPTTQQPPFLPRELADALPFSSAHLPEILHKFSVTPTEARSLRATIRECETRALNENQKSCATSLESMLDFSVAHLGKDVAAASTHGAEESNGKEYTVTSVKKSPDGAKGLVVCNREDYPYAVFFCQRTTTAAAYQLDLTAADGSKAELVAVCHRETSSWNPESVPFKVLKVKPGEVPICHVLPQDNVVWIPK